jgi:hypothetical protein
MDAEYTVRRLIYDHTIKLEHGVSLVGYIDHEQCEPFEPPPLLLPRDAGEDTGGGCNGETFGTTGTAKPLIIYIRYEQLVGSHDAWRQSLFVDILTDGL